MMLARIFIAASIAAMLAGPALAQQAPVPAYGEKDKDDTWAQQQAKKDAERAYRRSLGNVPDKAAVDPWGSARGAEAPKAAAKTAPAKPKSASIPH